MIELPSTWYNRVLEYILTARQVIKLYECRPSYIQTHLSRNCSQRCPPIYVLEYIRVAGKVARKVTKKLFRTSMSTYNVTKMGGGKWL
jgi:hypothetical protein